MPNVIVIRGPIGAGKSTVMNTLAHTLPNHSAVELDSIKRMIGPAESSEWRREVALNSALYIARSLLAHDRSVVTEVHSRWPEHSYAFLRLADSFEDTRLHRVLVTAPFDLCLARVRERRVPGIGYQIDERMAEEYYVNLTPTLGETVIDTSVVGPVEAGKLVVNALAKTDMKG